MKTKQILFAVWLLVIGILLYSCVSSVPAQKAALFRKVDFNHVVPLFPDDKKSDSKLTLSFSLLEADSRAKDIEFVTNHLYQGLNPSQYRDFIVQKWQAGYLENREFAGSRETLSMSFNWEYRETMDFELLNERGLTVRRETYVYSGGAHGMGTVQYFTFDLGNHKVLKFDDFFRKDTDERFYSIVISELRRYSNSHGGTFLEENQPLSMGIFFENNPVLTYNFFITKEGLGLNWAPYEIAPYSEGSIEIVLPWRTVRPLLQHDMMELLEKFGIYMFM